MKSEMASSELLTSEPVSPLVCVGMASAICLRILSVLRGLFAILCLDLSKLWSARNLDGKSTLMMAA